LLYDCYDNNDEEIANSGKFVGVRIKMPPVVNYAVQIDSVALYFNEAKTFTIYLFNDLKKVPIWSTSVTTVPNSQVVISLPDVVLNHIGSANHGGIFYLGYFQDDLGTAKAIRESNVKYPGTFIYQASHFQADKETGIDFDRKQISYTRDCYGINPHISVFVDHTWEIVKKASLFDNAIGLQFAAQVVEQSLFTSRSNSTERNLKEATDKVLGSLALDGIAPISDGPRTTGLRQQLSAELKRMRDSFFPKQNGKIVNTC
jgi:hypothetical protein